MEILIVGVILVALMVYVSTKIKKSAAQAYEREVVETENFNLIKPEGFISPIDENSKYEFEAYSKDFGDREAHNIRQASVTLSAFPNADFDSISADARNSADRITSEKMLTGEFQDQKICLLEGEKNENETSFYVLRKIVESRGQQKVYDLKISILSSSYEEYSERANEIMQSFSLK